LGALSATPAWAETVTYDAAHGVTPALQTITDPTTSLTWNALAPAGSGNPTNKSNSLTGNTVTLISGMVDTVYGAINYVDSDAVTGNQVFIRGGTTASAEIAGGRSINSSGNATASGNTVTITGGTLVGVVGGTAAATGLAGATGTANSNTINISGSPTFAAGNIAGGYVNASTVRVSQNNTLNLHASGLVLPGSLLSFQNLNFYLPQTLTSPGGTMLTANIISNLRDLPIQVAPAGCAKVGAFLDADTPATLHAGDITLIAATTMANTACFADAGGNAMPTVAPAATDQAHKMGDVGGRPYNVWLNGTNLMLTLGLNTEANLVSDPTGLQVTPGGGGSGLTKTAADLIKASVTVPNSKTALTLADVMTIVSTDAAVNIFSDAGFAVNANATGVALNVGSGNHVYIAVTSEDGLNTLYYDLTVTRSLALSTSSAAAVPTLNEWALMLLALAMLGMAGLHTRRRG